MSVSWQEYLSDIVSFQTDVQTLVSMNISLLMEGPKASSKEGMISLYVHS